MSHCVHVILLQVFFFKKKYNHSGSTDSHAGRGPYTRRSGGLRPVGGTHMHAGRGELMHARQGSLFIGNQHFSTPLRTIKNNT